MRKAVAAFTAAFVLLAGCGGGSGTALSPAPGGGDRGTGLETVHATIVLGGTSGSSTSAGVRRPKFISPSTNGIDIKVYAHGGNTIIGESMTDISSGSAACGGQTGLPRTCTVAVPAPAGNDDFVATTYDAAPVSNSFAAAHVLGRGLLNTTIVSGANNQLTLYISGVINSLGFLAPHASLPADGAVHTLGFVLNPADFDANPITAGANDPYSNPINLTITETGGSGHMTFVKNGTQTGSTSASLNYSSDTIAVRYDGGASSGYYADVAVSATGGSPPTPETLTISPLYRTSASPYYSSGTLTFTAAGQTAQINLSETNNASATYTATGATCAGIATASAPSGPANAASSTITATGNGSCTFAFSDGTSTINVAVQVSTTGGSVNVPGYTTGPITFASYSNGPVRGQNGWLSNSCGNSDYNANVVNTSSYPSSTWPGTPPTKALQIDNSVTQGCFSGLGSPLTPHAAGYPNALADTSINPPTQCGPTCQPFFSVEFLVTSATGAWQPALGMSISPVYNNQGARMQYIGLWHTKDPSNVNKLLVFTNDVQGLWPGNPPGTTAPCFQCVNFVAHEIAYVDPALPHKVGMTMTFVQPNADVVKFYVDGVLAGTQYRSWEDYYTMDTESDPGATYPYSRAVNDLLFHPGNYDSCANFADYDAGCLSGTGVNHTTTANNGFLFTNITTCAGTATVCASAIQTSGFRRGTQSTSFAAGRPAGRVHSAALVR